MVDVSHKQPVIRIASAAATVNLGSSLVQMIQSDERDIAKGNVIATAKLAGIQAAKQTSSLIPLCHLIPLNVVHVDITFSEECAHIVCFVKAFYNTGVEMEALTGATVTALTVYDMCKAINKRITITDVHLLKKDKVSTVH